MNQGHQVAVSHKTIPGVELPRHSPLATDFGLDNRTWISDVELKRDLNANLDSSLPGKIPCVRVSARSRNPSPDLSVPARQRQHPSFSLHQLHGSEIQVITLVTTFGQHLDRTYTSQPTSRANSSSNGNATNYRLESGLFLSDLGEI